MQVCLFFVITDLKVLQKEEMATILNFKNFYKTSLMKINLRIGLRQEVERLMDVCLKPGSVMECKLNALSVCRVRPTCS